MFSLQKRKITAPHCWPFVMEINRWPDDSHDKGPVMLKTFPIMNIITTTNFRITGPLWWESTSDWLIPITKGLLCWNRFLWWRHDGTHLLAGEPSWYHLMSPLLSSRTDNRGYGSPDRRFWRWGNYRLWVSVVLKNTQLLYCRPWRYPVQIMQHLFSRYTRGNTILQYIPRNMHTVLLCFALLWLCNCS